MVKLIDLILEQESGGDQLYHFTTLVDGLQIVNPSEGSLIWSQAVRTGDGNVPFFSLTSKRSFDSGYPLIQRYRSENLDDLKLVRISFDKDRLKHYALDSYHYDTSNAQGTLAGALARIENPEDRDEAEVRITRQNSKETLQDLRDSITAVDILVDEWVYKEFTKTLQTKNKFEGLVRSFFDSSQNAFRDKTHIISSNKGVEKSVGYWKDKQLGMSSGHPLMSGQQFSNLRPKFDYNDAILKQLGHLVAYCSKLLPGGALKYFDCFSEDELSKVEDAAKESPGNFDAATNAYRTLNIQNKLKGPQKAVLRCVSNLVDDFEDYLKEEGILEPDRNYRFDEIATLLHKEGWINENNNMENFDYKQYLAEGWMFQETGAKPKFDEDYEYDLVGKICSLLPDSITDSLMFDIGELHDHVRQNKDKLTGNLEDDAKCLAATFSDNDDYWKDSSEVDELRREPNQATTGDLKGFATKDATLNREKRVERGNWKGSIGKFVEQHGSEIQQAVDDRSLIDYIDSVMRPALGEEAQEYLDDLISRSRTDAQLLFGLYNVALKGNGLGLHE